MNYGSTNQPLTKVLGDKTNTQFYSSKSKIYSSSGNLFSTILGKNTTNTPTATSKIQMSPTNLTSNNISSTQVRTNNFLGGAGGGNNAFIRTSNQQNLRYFSPHKNPSNTTNNQNTHFQVTNYTSSSSKINYNYGEKEIRGSYIQNSYNENSTVNVLMRSPQLSNQQQINHNGSIYQEEQFVHQISSPVNPKVKINTEKIKKNDFDLKRFKQSDFEFGKKLGQGKFGNVYLAREKATNYIVAIKMMNKESIKNLKAQKQVVREIKLHSYLSHENVIQLYGVFHDDENIYLILEYASDGEVYKELRSSVSFF